MLIVLFAHLLKRYSPACTRLLSQYKTMLKLVGDDVPSIEDFMSRYHVSNLFLGACTLVADPHTHFIELRWTIRQLCIASKLGCPRLSNIQARPVQKQESGWRKQLKFVTFTLFVSFAF